jgi:glucokinase
MPSPDQISTRLVVDIGGTNTRIALFESASGEFRATGSYKNRDYAEFTELLRAWLAQLDEPHPASCCIAAAAPPSTDRVVMFNNDWEFSCSDLAQEFGFEHLRRINDFESNAYALPYLTGADRVGLHAGREGQSGALATLGPGTGLGGAVLDWTAQQQAISRACEPGHMGLAPGSQLELEVFQLLLPRYGNIYAELLVSGPGLLRLYQSLAEIRGETALLEEPADITAQALADADALCVETLDTFCALLGSVCGDFILANGSYGGLYLAGGIVPRVIPFIRRSAFHQRMCSKGAMQEHLDAIPVYAITANHPGLIGAAHAPL